MIIMIHIPCCHLDKRDVKERSEPGVCIYCVWLYAEWVFGFCGVKLKFSVFFFFHLSQGNVDECELRVLLHQSLAGCVIGKGGSKIKELKDVSTAKHFLITIDGEGKSL